MYASCVSREYQVTETYYETEYKTEYKTETYTGVEEIETIIQGEDLLLPKLQWNQPKLALVTDRFGIGGAGLGTPNVRYFGYEIPGHETSRIEVTIAESSYASQGLIDVWVCDVGGVGHIEKPPFTIE